MKNALYIFLLVFPFSLGAQDLFVGDVEEYPANMVSYAIDEMGDTVPHITHYTCVIVGTKVFKSHREQVKWDKLKRDVKAAYPYAVLARMKLAQMDSQLVLIKGEKERTAFNEKCEKELTDQFESDMRNLSFTQGKILFKLIDRETGSTTYQLIKQRRGSFSAFMWQSVAFVFGNNLKAEYDPAGEDKAIEEVVVLIELGIL
ncbi:MAG TPA: DUF4294 domain-containing protein [Bacteroidia bacterium]|nr:DUF4294 domain-containing protein [Bacteroidia bacterium]